MRSFVLAVIVAASLASSFGYEGYPEMPSFSKTPQEHAKIIEARKKLDFLEIKHLDLRNKSLGDVVAGLHEYFSEGRGQVSFILRYPNDAQKPRKLSTLILNDVSLPQALNKICEEFEMRWSCEGKIFIYP